jgi:hypothetical protein
VSKPEPCCEPSEAEARQDPLADDTLVVWKDVRWEDVDKERHVLHGADYEQKQKKQLVMVDQQSKTRPIYSWCYTSQRCVKRKASQNKSH